MRAQPTPDATTRIHHDVRDAGIGAAQTGGRPDVAGRLPASRHQPVPHAPDHGSATVQVAGATPQERTALVTALRRGSDRVTLTGGTPSGPLGTAVDAVLLVASAAQVIGPAELDQARALRHRSSHILFALTGVDRQPNWRDLLAADLERLRAVGVTVAPYAVSVDMHRRADAAGDPALAAASGIPDLARHLEELAAQTAPGTARTESTPPAPPRMPPAPTRCPAPNASARRPRSASDRAGPERNRWQQVLADGMAAASSDVDFDLRSRVRAAVADAERVVETSDPARNWDDFESWLRDRLTYEGEQTLALLADRTGEVAAALEQELGGEPLRRPAPPELPDLFGHEPLRDPPTAARRPLATRSRSLVMSGYGGLMMALILPRLAGVQIPMWVAVCGALAAAVLLGGATLSGERKRQLEARRTRSKALVRQCADGFLLTAGKHTRDNLRRAQQHLRNECAARK
jgi:hypothetical protein